MMQTEAESLVSDLADRYAAMRTYRDRGVVLQSLPAIEMPVKTTFETRFRRPGLLRFAFSSPHPFPPLSHIVTEYCCGADSAGAYEWRKAHDEPAHLTKLESLSLAIAGATGISGGSAHTIGSLLMPEIGGLRFTELHDFRIRGREAFEGHDCIVAESPLPGGGGLILWIHRDSMTLRKVVTKHPSFPPGEEIRRDIEIDAAIDDRELNRPA